MVPVERELPALPKQESYRVRRAARAAYDVMLPEAIRVVMEMFQSEKAEHRMWAAEKVFKQTLANIPNETQDPEEVVVDSTARDVDALRDLEKETEKGTGLPDE